MIYSYYNDLIDSSCALVPPDRFTIGTYINLHNDCSLTIDIPQFYVIITVIRFFIKTNQQLNINMYNIICKHMMLKHVILKQQSFYLWIPNHNYYVKDWIWQDVAGRDTSAIFDVLAQRSTTITIYCPTILCFLHQNVCVW